MDCYRCECRPRAKWSSYCAECRKEYDREYQSRPEVRKRANARSTARRRKVSEQIRHMKESGSCTDCGRQDHFFLMEYDHLGDKEMSISDMISANKSVEQIKKEIAKCELVCVRCHKIRTHCRRFELDPSDLLV